MVLTALVNLLDDAVKLLAVMGREACCVSLHVVSFLYQPLDVREEILGTNQLGCVRSHAGHVRKALERTLLAAEQPVDRTVLVHLLVILPEVLHEVAVDALA